MMEDRPSGGPMKKKKEDDERLQENMEKIRHKILVLSGKGGVGKSTVAVNLAVALGMEGRRVGLLDVDFHGPSIPTLLHLEGKTLQGDGESMLPVEFSEGLKVVSLGFVLSNPDDAVIWRGPLKMGVIKQLLSDVRWGDLDYLVVDLPPGTGDEPLSMAQLITGDRGAVVVTTPQDLSVIDVRKSISFCRRLGLPVLGIIENMSGLVCPHCGGLVYPFKSGGGEAMAREMGLPFLGRIPMDPLVVAASDKGQPFIYAQQQSEAAKAFTRAVHQILALDKDSSVKK
ncbi:MAG: Mrp/NBP35 family ATP-binding protein [Deltaproteobacteria bacterium]|nr:Mrp/NBP35 family ATP-binding protein [Deltaproteobacteria bacterium]